MATPVSVIIPVRDRPEFLPGAVESLIATGYPSLEIVIVDDGSRDGTLDRARELEARFTGLVRLLRHGDRGNHGPGASRNLGVREARGTYVAFLDSDDVVLSNRFAAAVPILDEDPSADAVAEGFLIEEGEDGPFQEVEGADSILPELAAIPVHWQVASILIRRDCFLESGGFSEELRTCEDLVLWMKLLLSVRIVPGGAEPVALYRRHEGNTELVLQNTLLACLEVARWTRSRAVDPGKAAVLRRVTWGKTLFVCDRLVGRGRPGMAIQMLRSAARENPSFLFRQAFWRNYARALAARRASRAPRRDVDR